MFCLQAQLCTVVMMCAARDDPMDLGPFLQEYVLRNPFENLPNGVPPGLAPGKQSGQYEFGL